MASTCEEQLLCPICLNTYTEPVSTPCGHNYCKTCITEFWSNTGDPQCPTCLDTFRAQPKLKVNAAFGNLVKHVSSMTERGEEETPAKPGEVPCDLCSDPKLKARRSCLGCLASYCRRHLEQHQRVPTFKNHRLVEPTSNLEDNICEEHDEVLKLFCETDQVCVCVMCLQGDHGTHETVPLEVAYREKRDLLLRAAAEMERREISRERAAKNLKGSAEQSAKKWKEEMAEIAEALESLVAYLRRSQTELAVRMQEKQRAAQASTRGLVASLKKEADEWRGRRGKAERVLRREDHVHLLQRFASLADLPPARRARERVRPDSYADPVRDAVARMQATLGREMEALTQQVGLPQPPGGASDEEVKVLDQDQLRTIKRYHTVRVILDPGSGNSRFLVSPDGKTLKGSLNNVSRDRFSSDLFFLGKEGFSSGSFYYQVQISDAQNCFVGVAGETPTHRWVFRKSTDSSGRVSYRSLFESPLNLQHNPPTVGVFVDYEKGEVSFCDADTGALFYTHTGCAFGEPSGTMKDFLFSLAGYHNRPKLYPIFGISGNDDTLVITP